MSHFSVFLSSGSFPLELTVLKTVSRLFYYEHIGRFTMPCKDFKSYVLNGYVVCFPGKAPWDLEQGGDGFQSAAAASVASARLYCPSFSLADLRGMDRDNMVIVALNVVGVCAPN